MIGGDRLSVPEGRPPMQSLLVLPSLRAAEGAEKLTAIALGEA
jgi:hypothetical protein